MVISRYVIKEILVTLLALTAILLLIFLSNQFMRYLSHAASGKMPIAIVMHLMMLEVPNMLGILLPLGLFLGLIIGYGRLYADNEMTVLSASGFSQLQLMILTLKIAAGVTLVVAFLSFWLSPKVVADRQLLLAKARSTSLVSLLEPNRFYALHHGKDVVYVGGLKNQRGQQIFLAQLGDQHSSKDTADKWQVITAKRGDLINTTQGQFVRLHDGQRYVGQAGDAAFEVDEFKQFAAQITQKTLVIRKKIRTLSMLALWHDRHQLQALTELQWRISIPLSVLVLALFAVPMSRVNPRQGKYSKILPAVIVYMLYANCFFIARRWLSNGKISPALGMWWIHGLLLLLTAVMLLTPIIKQRIQQRRQQQC